MTRGAEAYVLKSSDLTELKGKIGVALASPKKKYRGFRGEKIRDII